MSDPWIVLKFGGSSVAEPHLWQTIADVIEQRQQQGYRPLLVLSALKNVSNQLENLLHQSIKGEHQRAIDSILNHHLNFSKQLGLSLDASLAPWIDLLSQTCEKIYQQQQITPQQHAKVVAIGELLSSTIGAAFLKNKNTDVTWCDARQLLKTSDKADAWHHFTAAQCEYNFDNALKQKLDSLNGVLVTQGFIAADENNHTVLLGREGSDTSAAYFGAKLNASRIEIWTDVPGVFSSNPREISAARQIPFLDYSHAHLLAQFGAKVLHPRALAPAAKYQIPLMVKCTKLAHAKGTEISSSHAIESPAAAYNTCALARLDDIYYFKYPMGKVSSQQTVSQLMALGFDKICEFEKAEKHNLLMVYSNSDVGAPTELEINRQLNCDSLEIHRNLSLISLLGYTDEVDWIGFINEYVDQQVTVPIVQTFSQANSQIFAILVQQNDGENIATQLHRELIEKTSQCNLFAESWPSFGLTL